MTTPRGLSPEEAALWAKVASTVRPISPARTGQGKNVKPAAVVPVKKSPRPKPASRPAAPPASRPAGGAPTPRNEEDKRGLDSHWERRLSRTSTQPDFSLDLHGHTLDQAYDRLNDGLTQAKAMGARLVLVVTGKPRPVDAADRANKRGAIRAKILDWLAAGQHASDIAAIRKAHRRHGGEGALYIVLKRRR